MFLDPSFVLVEGQSAMQTFDKPKRMTSFLGKVQLANQAATVEITHAYIFARNSLKLLLLPVSL